MPAVIAVLWQAFYAILGSLVGRALLALGMGVVTYKGVSVVLSWLKTKAVENFAALPADVLGMLSTMKVGEVISIIFSAILVRLTLNGLSSDTVKRWRLK
jgi:hypothetical protein